jgi:hypothetical protein
MSGQRKDRVSLRRPKQNENLTILTPQFGSEFSRLLERNWFGTRLQAFCAEIPDKKCVSLPVILFLLGLGVVIFGQFVIPMDDSLRYVCWIAMMISSLFFTFLAVLLCPRAFIMVAISLFILMLLISTFGLLKSANAVNWRWLGIFSPLFVIPIILLIWFCYMSRPNDEST